MVTTKRNSDSGECVSKLVVKGSDKIWFAQMLRGVAALMVVYAHIFVCRVWWIGGIEIKDPYLEQIHLMNYFERFYDFLAQKLWLNLGAIGVGIFFLISGFVISFSINKRSRLNFLLNRIIRIFPVVISALLVDYIVLCCYHIVWTDANNLPNLRDYLVNSMLLLRPVLGTPFVNGVLWTLEIEFVFYVIVCILGRKINSPRALFVVYIALFALWHLCSCIDASKFPVVGFIKTAIPHIYIMFCGVFFYNLYKGNLKKGAFPLWGGVMILAPFTVAIYLNYENFPNNPELYLSYTVFPLILFTLAYLGRNAIQRSSVFDFFANISFSLYLAHQMVGYAIVGFLIHFGANIYMHFCDVFTDLVLCNCFE